MENRNDGGAREILLVTIGTLGDVLPFLVIGRDLQQRGLKVTIATHDHYRDKALAYGLAFESVADTDLQQFTAHEDAWHPERGVGVAVDKLLLPMLEPVFELTRRLAAGRDLLVLAHPHALGARVAQDLLNLRLWTLYPSAWLFQSVHARQTYPRVKLTALGGESRPSWRDRMLDRLADRVLGEASHKPGIIVGRKEPMIVRRLARGLFRRLSDDMLAQSVNALRHRVGLPAVEGVLTDWCHSPQKAVGLFPAWYAEPQRDWPPRHLLAGFVEARSDAPLADDLRAFLDAGPAPVVFTFGSEKLANRNVFAAAAKACRELGLRAIFVSPEPEQVPPTQADSIFQTRFVPFDSLFAHVACVVHHGGMGTAAAALRAGVPQLLVPFSYDQPDNASRLRGLGIGVTLAPGLFDGEHLVGRLRQLVGDEAVLQHCRRCAEQIRRDDSLGAIAAAIAAAT